MSLPSRFKSICAAALQAAGVQPKTARCSRRRRPARASRLNVECLEERVVLSGNPLTSIPVLHSNAGAPATLFLDFDGHFEALSFGVSNVTTPAYDFDGDPTTFSDAELANIEAIWFRVAEDYAPFNIDVTTVEPAVLAAGVPADAANGVALRVAIGGTSDWYGPGLGGVSSPNMFTNSVPNVAYAFAQGNSSPSVADVVSHEAGHAFGLVHQSESTIANESNTRPIMYGSGGIAVLATWHNGVNALGNVQDDMAIIAGTTNGFGYRGDDYGNSTGTATTLTQTGNTWSGAGIVGTNTDVDMFSFTISTQDTYRIAVNGLIGPGGDVYASNLDVAIELRNAAGSLIYSASPQDARSAEITKELTPGTYFLTVKSNGVYGQIGQYTVGIDAPPAGITVTPASNTMTTGEDGRATSFTVALQTAPTANVTIPISSSNSAEGTVSAASLVFTSANWDIPQVATITGVSDGILDDDSAYSVVIGAAVSADAEYSGLDPADISVINLDNDVVGFLYYVDGATIQRSRVSGAQPETLIDLIALYGTSSTYTPNHLGVDLAHGKLYWTDSSADRIQRSNLDGSNVQTVISGGVGLGGLSLDTAAGKMYWVNGVVGKIQRANLDGTAIEDLVTGLPLSVRDIALDSAAGKFYWIQLTEHTIQRANLNGSNVETVWTGTASAKPYAIALDTGAGKMYWADFGDHRIRRANLDGSNEQVVVDAGAFSEGSADSTVQVIAVALDVSAGKIYFGDGTLKAGYRANFDGSGIAAVVSTQQRLRGIAIAHPGPEISVTHRTGLVTSENGGSDIFRVSLTTQPTGDVTIALSSSDTTEGTLSTSSLTFTPANWNVTQTVTVSGVNDTVVDGDIAYTIVLAPAVSTDLNYQSFNPADVSLVNLDDDVLPTKFYVVNDATQNQTYEYNASGGLVESYNLNSGNTAPRGAASTIASDKVWVVDANRNVYVYNPAGGLLGSWTAGTLASNATVEGIATNGTDVWIVDAKSDKVFKYTGAASRLSGSQNAASSFSLNSGNANPKDIVTDGASLWVVNDASTDKVFKYSVAGALLGSWTIDAANTAPTGIAIDPASVSDIWIVDSGTDGVYRYPTAATHTSGSYSATFFALAAGNTNPQGIADPPVNSFPGSPENPLVGRPSQAVTATGWEARPTVAALPLPAAQFNSFPGSAWERTAIEALPRLVARLAGWVEKRGTSFEADQRGLVHRGTEATYTKQSFGNMRSQAELGNELHAEPGNEFRGTPTSARSDSDRLRVRILDAAVDEFGPLFEHGDDDITLLLESLAADAPRTGIPREETESSSLHQYFAGLLVPGDVTADQPRRSVRCTWPTPSVRPGLPPICSVRPNRTDCAV